MKSARGRKGRQRKRRKHGDLLKNQECVSSYLVGCSAKNLLIMAFKEVSWRGCLKVIGVERKRPDKVLTRKGDIHGS